eukprot:gene26113-31531_t
MKKKRPNVPENWKTMLLGCGSNAFSQLNFPAAHMNCLNFYPIPTTSTAAGTPTHQLKSFAWYPQQVSCGGNMSACLLVADVNSNIHGNTTNPPTSSSTTTEKTASVSTNASVNATSQHQALYIWGTASHASVSSIFKTPLFMPVKLDNIHQIACGHAHVAFVTSSGKLFTFGLGEDGVLGHGGKSNVPTPKQVEKLKTMHVGSVACGAFHTAVIATPPGEIRFIEVAKADENYSMCTHSDMLDMMFEHNPSANRYMLGSLYVFGQGKAGQLGLPMQSFTKPNVKIAAYPTLVPFFPEQHVKVVKVSCGLHHTAVLGIPSPSPGETHMTRSSVYSFGYNEFGRLGVGHEDSLHTPHTTPVPTPSCVVDVACGDIHTLCCDLQGRVFAWGGNDFGQLGVGAVAASAAGETCQFSPCQVPLPEGYEIAHVAAGGRHSMCVTKGGRVVSFGWGEEGQLGHGQEKNFNLPKPSPLPRDWGDIIAMRVSLGMSHSLALVYNPMYRKPSVPAVQSPVPAPPKPLEPEQKVVKEEEVAKPPPSPFVLPQERVDEEEMDQGVGIRGIRDLLQRREGRLAEEDHEDSAEEDQQDVADEKEEDLVIPPSPPRSPTPPPPVVVLPDPPLEFEEPALVEPPALVEEVDQEELRQEVEDHAVPPEEVNSGDVVPPPQVDIPPPSASATSMAARPATVAKVQVFYQNGQDLDKCLVANSAKRAEARKAKKSQANASTNQTSGGNSHKHK